ncbi:MAG: hypothetical protein AAFU78_06935 [Cyanobacteria bacterium J06633_2]
MANEVTTTARQQAQTINRLTQQQAQSVDRLIQLLEAKARE